jgi:hypothetical protein
MEDAVQYRKYAEECCRLATIMPEEHGLTLLEIAEAWRKCAAEAERETSDVAPRK